MHTHIQHSTLHNTPQSGDLRNSLPNQRNVPKAHSPNCIESTLHDVCESCVENVCADVCRGCVYVCGECVCGCVWMEMCVDGCVDVRVKCA